MFIFKRALRAVSSANLFHRVCGLLALSLLLWACGESTSPSAPAATSRHLVAAEAAAQRAAAPLAAVANGPTPVWVMMRQAASVAQFRATRNWQAQGEQVTRSLRSTASSSQQSLRAFLNGRNVPFKSFWIVNAMKVTAEPALINEIARRPDVARIVADSRFEIPPLQERAAARPSAQAVEWGLSSIRAPEVWDSFGARGDGIVVANIDTGVQFDHPALVNQYRGNQGGSFDHNYNWYDPTGVCGAPSDGPCDNAEHGTHTMGTIVGDDSLGNPIGVAPHARWIAAKGCEDIDCSTESLLSSGQWLLAPTDLRGENPRPDLRPNIINNSWSGAAADPFYQAVVQAWRAAGIFPVFSAGNWGDFGCETVGSPGDYPAAYTVGAYDIDHFIASFSGKGPSLLDGESKPDIAAPGVDVRSSVPGGYARFSGTSMAAPHVAGTIALLWSAAPTLIGDVDGTIALLGSTALDTADLSCGGDEGDNGVWGEGRLDAYAAVEQAPRGPTGVLAGIVSTPAGRPLAGARIRAEGETVRETYADPEGRYRAVLPAGTYTVIASAFGYEPRSAATVVIVDRETTLETFSLEASPVFPVSGTVTDSEGQPLAGVVVALAGTPLPPRTTDAAGAYAFPTVPAGTYEVSVTPSGCYSPQRSTLVVDGAEVLSFVSPRRVDGFGYFCQIAEFDFIEANTVLPITFDGASIVPLPFPFSFYGQQYSSVEVSATGYVQFGAPLLGGVFSNTAIPDGSLPNAAIYPFWDDLVVDLGSSVRTDVVGTAPERQFIIEWRDVSFFSDFVTPVRFELVLHEDGRILMQYFTHDPDPAQKGNSATVGLENENGSDAFQYSFDTASLSSGVAILYDFPPSGIVRGTVTEAGNSRVGVAGATIQATSDGAVVRTVKSAADGRYSLQVPVGNYTIVASKLNHGTEASTASVFEDTTVTADFALRTARVIIEPPSLQLTVPQSQVRTRLITLQNAGTLPFEYSFREAGGALQRRSPGAGIARNAPAPIQRAASDTRELFGLGPRQRGGWIAELPGDVLRAFAPLGLASAWGVGYTGKLWLSDFTALSNHEFTALGGPTGREWTAPWAGLAVGDMSYDAGRGLFCQVAIEGGGNGIHCWSPDSGEVIDSITGTFPWAEISQRGLAYRPDDDSFYIGGWNQGVIYHVQGLSGESPGQVIGSCTPSDRNISGLAWNDSVKVLWMATNSDTDTVYELNPDDCTVLATLAHPAPGFNGAGLELDESGNLWMVSQVPNQVFLVDSGVPAFSDVKWLSQSPTNGTVAPGETATIEVTLDTTGLEPGAHLASLFVQSNAGVGASQRIPISLLVPAYQQAVDSGSRASHLDTAGDIWASDQPFASGSWGYLQEGAGPVTTTQSIAGTADPVLYQSQRVDPHAYAFDDVPNGIYEVNLRFAEFTALSFGERLFDVIIENTVVLHAHDIRYEAGASAADDHTFFVEVTDARLDIRLAPRTGFANPVINALRVTHRTGR
jgi:subtilisin family serine protease